MLMNSPACKWCHPEQAPLARNRSHMLVDKPHPTHPGVLVVTHGYVESPFEMTVEEWSDRGDMLREARAHLAQFNPAGFTLGWNVGEAGGQHVFHAHMHVVCRFEDERQAGRGLRDFVLR